MVASDTYGSGRSRTAGTDDPPIESAEPLGPRFPVLRLPRKDAEPLALTIEPDRSAGPWSSPHLPSSSVESSGAESFSVQAFEQELIRRLQDRCIGFSYAINTGGQLAAANGRGLRRTGADGGELPSSSAKRMHIASVAKNLTATAVLAALAQTPGVSVESRIVDFLPSLWAVGPGVSDIRFRHLLTHSSGIGPVFGASTTYATLQATIATGGVTPGGSFAYDNRNFGLLRIILPYLVCPPVMLDAEIQGFQGGTYDELVDQRTSELYVQLLRFYVFDRIGIANAACLPNASDDGRTRFYPFPDTGNQGQDGGDWTRRSGGAGWVLSAYALAKYMAFRRYSELLLAKASRDAMDQQRYGWLTTQGAKGTYLRHGGAFTVSGPLLAEIMQFPINVEAAVLVNSNLTAGSNLDTVVRDAFDAAWS